MRDDAERHCSIERKISRRDGLKFGAGILAALAASPLLAQTTPVGKPKAVAAPEAGKAPSDAPLFDLLPDWSRASAEKPMTMGDLVNLKDAAIRFLKRNESGDLPALEKELQDFSARYCQSGASFDVKRASGLYILLRVIFDLPDITGANEAWNFGGWYALEDQSALKEKREADDFHPAWPVYLARISNKLYIRSDTNPGALGQKPDYRAFDEYRFLRDKYRFRTADSIAKMEFIFIAGK